MSAAATIDRAQVLRGTMPIMTDAEVAALFCVSVRTLARRVASPVPGEIDINKARPTVFGRRRIWLRADVMRVIGLPAK